MEIINSLYSLQCCIMLSFKGINIPFDLFFKKPTIELKCPYHEVLPPPLFSNSIMYIVLELF